MAFLFFFAVRGLFLYGVPFPIHMESILGAQSTEAGHALTYSFIQALIYSFMSGLTTV